MPDGTPFSFPEISDSPSSLTISENTKAKRIFLCLPVYRPGSEEVSFDDDGRSLARFRVSDEEVSDQNSVAGDPAPIQTAHLRLRLLAEDEVPEDWMTVGVCQVVERRNDLSVALDDLSLIHI